MAGSGEHSRGVPPSAGGTAVSHQQWGDKTALQLTLTPPFLKLQWADDGGNGALDSFVLEQLKGTGRCWRVER